MKTISRAEAQQIILAAQGLNSKNPFGIGLNGTRQAIQHLGYVQIDTISVVERAHHHILWSRVSDYQPKFLDQLMADKSIFEYWSHAASFLPMEDYRFSLPRKKAFASGKRSWFLKTPDHLRLRKNILARIKAEGPLAAKDFKNTREKKGTGWWDWKPAKQVLEQMFMEGQLMISSRKAFQKQYDLTENVLPNNTNTKFPTPTEFARHLILKGAAANGLTRTDEIAYQRTSMRECIQKECRHLLHEGRLKEYRVDGIEKSYVGLPEIQSGKMDMTNAQQIKILSPFDNQVIQRKRLKELFNYDYTIECYVPATKRKFGYFSLPILKGDQFVGRIDIKADRKEKVLKINSLHIEKGQGKKSIFWQEAKDSLREFAEFNSCPTIKKT